MKKIIILTLLTALLLPAKELPKEKDLVEGKLANGFSYAILHNEKPKDFVEFRLIVDAGSLEEDDDQRGLAHFTEHMAFNGTKHFKKNELISYLESIGLKFGGDLNANTGFTRTLYKLSVPVKEKNVDTALTILDDWAGGLLFNPKEFDKERGVVLEEKRLRNSPSFRLYQQYAPLFYGKSKYKDRIVIGKEEVLKHAPVQRVVDFYQKWYRPELMHLVVVGDVNVTEMEGKIKTYFSELKNKSSDKPVSRLIAESNSTRIMALTDRELFQNTAEVYYMERVFGAHTKAEKKRNIITRIAQKIFNLEAKKELLKTESKALNIFAGTQTLTPYKKAYLFKAIYSEKDRKEAFSQLYRLMWRFEKFGFEQRSFEQVKKQLLEQNENEHKEIQTTDSGRLASALVRSIEHDAIFVDREEDYLIVKALIQEITPEEVNARFKEIVNIQDRIILLKSTKALTVDKKKVLQSIDLAKKEVKEPSATENKELNLLQKPLQAKKIVKKVFDKETGIYSYSLENNVTVLFKPTTFRQNEVLLSAVSPGGLSALPTEALNDAKKASGWVMQSAPGTLKPDELRTLMADKSARVNFRISRFDEKIDGSSNSKDLETLLKLLYVYVTTPKIDPGVDRQLSNSALALARQLDRDPAYKFNKALNKFYYMDNPRILFDNKESIERLNNEKMLKLFKKKFTAMNHFTFMIVGDTKPEAVEKLIALYLANLPTSTSEEKINAKPFAYKKGKQTFVRPFNASNIANTGLKYRLELDYNMHDDIVLSIMQEILNVRLRNLIREDKSGTYGVGIKCSIIRELEKTSSCNIRFASDPIRENELVESIEKSIKNFIEEGPTAQELKNIQTEYALMYKKALRDNYFWLDLMTDHAKFKDDIKTLLTFNEEIKKITRNEVQKMAEKMFNGDLLLSKRIPQMDSEK